jgi:hypothetical protein
MSDAISVSAAVVATAIALVALVLFAVGRGVVRELRLRSESLRESLKGIEARLRGLEDALAGIHKEMRGRDGAAEQRDDRKNTSL